MMLDGNDGDGDGGARLWAAVQRRDPAADGRFVYAVRTTGIYCRPVCRARLARRANVAFFAAPAPAEEGGYRACKRCRPEVPGRMPESAAVARVRAFISGSGSGSAGGRGADDAAAAVGGAAIPGTHAAPGQTAEAEQATAPTEAPADGRRVVLAAAQRLPRRHRRPGQQQQQQQLQQHRLTTRDLAASANVSRWHFHRTFKKLTGATPSGFLLAAGHHTAPSPSPSPSTTTTTPASSVASASTPGKTSCAEDPGTRVGASAPAFPLLVTNDNDEDDVAWCEWLHAFPGETPTASCHHEGDGEEIEAEAEAEAEGEEEIIGYVLPDPSEDDVAQALMACERAGA